MGHNVHWICLRYDTPKLRPRYAQDISTAIGGILLFFGGTLLVFVGVLSVNAGQFFFIKRGSFFFIKSAHFHEIHHFLKVKDPWFHNIHNFLKTGFNKCDSFHVKILYSLK